MQRQGETLGHLTSIAGQTTCDVVQEYADKALLKEPENIAAFVELHIEQGPHLEAEKKDIGIVEAIMAPALLRVEFTGRGGHGGEAPMHCVLRASCSCSLPGAS